MGTRIHALEAPASPLLRASQDAGITTEVTTPAREAAQGEPAGLEGRLAREVLDLLRDAVFVVDAAGGVIETNQAADALLSGSHGLEVGDAGLRAEGTAEDRRLRRAIAQAARDPRRSSGFLLLQGPGEVALRVTVMPLEGQDAAAVFVCDPARLEAPDAGKLQELYGLTRAESRVAVELARGVALPEVARALGVTTETVRGHLKHVYAKTDTHRQAELVHLLLTRPAGP